MIDHDESRDTLRILSLSEVCNSQFLIHRKILLRLRAMIAIQRNQAEWN